MQRTKFTTNKSKDDKLSQYSTLLARVDLFNRLGTQYAGKRDIYKALGYPTNLTFEDYAARYQRQDIAKAIIDRPINAVWRGQVKLSQGKRDKDTRFEKAWKELWKKYHLKSKFIRLHKLANIGRYAILLFGFNDVKSPNDWQKPVGKTPKLIYLNPISEGNATISSFDQKSTSERFGLPEFYNITLSNDDMDSAQAVSRTMIVHYTRILHVTSDLLESDIYGTPSLRPVYNRLMDLEKLVGGSAEMFWRGARPGYTGEVDKEHFMNDTMKADLVNQLDEYENELRRFLINEGVKITSLDTQISDPINHVGIQLQMISAEKGIPLRILLGSERGELASSEDKSNWLESVQNIQSDVVEDRILNPFIDKCLTYSILPDTSENYNFIWPDLFAPSIKERADIGAIRAKAVMSYMNNPAAAIVCPPHMFYEFMLGLTTEEIKYWKDTNNLSPEAILEAIIKQTQATQKAGTAQGRGVKDSNKGK